MNPSLTETAPQTFRHSRQARESETMLQRLTEEFPDNPKGMQYFYELYQRVFCEGEALGHEGPLVGTTCIQAPEELIYALGATPVRLCNGAYHFDQLGADLMPAKGCPLVKAALGRLSSKEPVPRVDKLDLIVNPTTCDQKKKSGAMMEAMGYAVFDLELPPSKDSEAARLYWQRSVRELVVRLKALTKNKLTRKNLAKAIARTSRAQAAFRRMHALRQSSPSVFLGKDAFLVVNAYFFDDLDRWTLAVERLNDELEQRQRDAFHAAQRKAPRVLFTGSPPIFPNLKVPMLIELGGGVVVADETCSANRMLYDMTAVDEWLVNDMVDSLADKYLKPCTCPIFPKNDDRKRRLLDLARTFAADGVVYQSLAGCQVYEMEYRSIAEALQKAGVPVLYIETDYSPDDIGQLSTRVEAFLESLKARKRKAS